MGRQIPVLDGLRGLAVLLVMLDHFAIGTSAPFRALRWGWCGVDLFFVLSGFLITGILEDAKQFPQHYYRNFYVRRILRIFPLYYGVLAVVFLILPRFIPLAQIGLGGAQSRQLWLWLYVANFGTLANGWLPDSMGHLWSLSVEEHFYFVWPFLVAVLARRALIRVCVIGALLVLAFRVGLTAAHVPWIASYYWTPSRMDALMIGGAIALVVRERGGMAPLVPAARVAAWISGALLVGIIAWRRGLSMTEWPVRTLGFSLLAIFWASWIAISVGAPASVLHRVFSYSALRFVGKYSYGLYVFHNLLHPLWTALFPYSRVATLLHSPALAEVLYICFASACSLLVALLSWHLFENQFLQLKRYFEYQRTDSRSAMGAGGDEGQRETAA